MIQRVSSSDISSTEFEVSDKKSYGCIAAGRSREEILKAYPYLEAEDIDQALVCAAWRVEEREADLILA
jgi:Protein of unknown function (DUF433)